jgi:hypothetical protein
MMAKPIILNTISIDLKDTTLSCITLLTFLKYLFIVFGTRKPTVSKAKGIDAC